MFYLLEGVNRMKKSNFLQTQLGAWAVSRTNLSDQQNHESNAKHQLDMQHKQEKHELQLKHDKEKHEVEMEILLLKKKKMLCNCICNDVINP